LQTFKCRIGREEFSPPPMLSEVADDVALVEIKPASVELVQAVIRIMAGRNWMLQSFDAANIRAAQQIEPDLPIAFLAEDEPEIRIGIDNGWRIHLDHTLLDDHVAKLLYESGKPFGAWTVNTEPDIKRVLDLGVSAIISDHPDLVRQVAQRLGFVT
jgi:glycerophosphoryl diester phosphodiesterase